MVYTLGLDVGSTYTKAVILNEHNVLVTRRMEATGSKLTEVAFVCVDPTSTPAAYDLGWSFCSFDLLVVCRRWHQYRI